MAPKTEQNKNASGSADLFFFNAGSSEIHIHHGNGVVHLPVMKTVPVPREIADPWLKTQVGQAYADSGFLRTSETEEMDFSSYSDLTPPKELTEPAKAGSIESTVEKREVVGGVTAGPALGALPQA